MLGGLVRVKAHTRQDPRRRGSSSRKKSIKWRVTDRGVIPTRGVSARAQTQASRRRKRHAMQASDMFD